MSAQTVHHGIAKSLGLTVLWLLLPGTAGGCFVATVRKGDPVQSPDGKLIAQARVDYLWHGIGLSAKPVAASFKVSWYPTGRPFLPRTLTPKLGESDLAGLNGRESRLVFSPDSDLLGIGLNHSIWIVELETGKHWRLIDSGLLVRSLAWLGPGEIGFALRWKTLGWPACGVSGSTDRFDFTFCRQSIRRSATAQVVHRLKGAEGPMSSSPNSPEHLWLPDGRVIDMETCRVLFRVPPARAAEQPLQTTCSPTDPAHFANADLAKLAQEHSSLTKLDLSGCRELTDLSPLSNLQRLTSLELRGLWALRDLTPLAQITCLRTLDLRGCKRVGDLAPLSKLGELRCLGLPPYTRDADLADVAARHPELTALHLTNCEHLTDLSPLAKLRDLRELNLSGCGKISDIAPLAGLTELQSLNLHCCWTVKSIFPLARLAKLRELNLHACNAVTDLRPLADLTRLEWVDLGHTWLSDGRILGKLAKLTGLNLRHSRHVLDLRHLSHLKNLTALGLSRSGFTHPEALAELKGLRLLDLYGSGPLIDAELAFLRRALPECRIYREFH